jgi:hypothetical protein
MPEMCHETRNVAVPLQSKVADDFGAAVFDMPMRPKPAFLVIVLVSICLKLLIGSHHHASGNGHCLSPSVLAE